MAESSSYFSITFTWTQIMADPKITLEYIRTLIWPLFALMVLLVFQNDIRGMISRGVELDILGVTIKGASGEELENLLTRETKLREAFDSLSKKLREQSDLNKSLAAEKEQLMAKNNRLQEQLVQDRIASGEDPGEFLQPSAAGVESNKDKDAVIASQELERDIQQNLNMAQMILASPSAKEASKYERYGFDNIISGEWESALENFQSAYQTYPDYHNVREIQRLLTRNIQELTADDKTTVRKVLQSIIERYSWGAPADVIKSIRKQLKT